MFDKAFTSTKYCEDIESIDYRVDKPRMLLRSQQSVLSQDDLNRKIDEKQIQGNIILKCVESLYKTYRTIFAKEKQKTLVEVKILRTNWIFRETNNVDRNDLFMLIDTLNAQKSD